MKKETKEIQSWALNEQNELVHAKDVDKSLKQTFHCPYCKDEMICKQGKVKRPHFAHKTTECSYDQYLHSLAKRRICEWFNKSNEVIIKINTVIKCSRYDNCMWKKTKAATRGYIDFEEGDYIKDVCKKKESKERNLKQWFQFCEEERDFVLPDGTRYRPDILCHNAKDENIPLFIEVCVTHPCEPGKIESGIRIIEVKIESEKDIENFISNPIEESDVVKFYGFMQKEITDEVKEGLPLIKYIHYSSGKVYIDFESFTCLNYDKKRKGDYEITMSYDVSRSSYASYTIKEYLYELSNTLTYKTFTDFRACNICKWSRKSINGYTCYPYQEIGTNKNCNENDASKCTYFQANKEKCKSLQRKVEEMIVSKTIDVWQKE